MRSRFKCPEEETARIGFKSLAMNETTDAVDSAVAGGNDTGVASWTLPDTVEASWLCGTAGPLWNRTLSWDTGDENPGDVK